MDMYVHVSFFNRTLAAGGRSLDGAALTRT
jgi:hypothetical protein